MKNINKKLIALLTVCFFSSSYSFGTGILDALKTKNPQWSPISSNVGFYRRFPKGTVHWKYTNPTGEQVINGISLKGENLLDCTPLKDYNLDFLSLTDTGIKNLEFIHSLKKGNDFCLQLKDNKKLINFSALSDMSIVSIYLTNQEFLDTSIFSENVKDIYLHNTHIQTLKFRKPENIKFLILNDNSLLTNFSQISKMSNLKLFSGASLPVSFDYNVFEKLTKIKSLGFTNCAIECLPHVKMKKLQSITMMKCNLLKDISALKDKEIKQLWIINIPAVALETLGKCRIKELLIWDTGIKNLSFLKSIDGIDSLKIKEKELSSIEAIKEIKINKLSFASSKIKDISALKGMNLKSLDLSFTEVSDLTPLIGMELEYLDIQNTPTAKKPLPQGLKVKKLMK